LFIWAEPTPQPTKHLSFHMGRFRFPSLPSPSAGPAHLLPPLLFPGHQATAQDACPHRSSSRAMPPPTPSLHWPLPPHLSTRHLIVHLPLPESPWGHGTRLARSRCSRAPLPVVLAYLPCRQPPSCANRLTQVKDASCTLARTLRPGPYSSLQSLPPCRVR
jgi:hypothetical protein